MNAAGTQTFIVVRDNTRPFRFTGERIAVVTSSPDRGHPDFSGYPGITQILALYVTERGQHVAGTSYVTERHGHRDSHDAIITDNRNEVFRFFGFGWLAMKLYTAAGWDIAEDLDKVA